ncbi:hypothetical protein Tco_0472584 [Tanacetum coccineum]
MSPWLTVGTSQPQKGLSRVYSLVRTKTPLCLTSGYYLRRTPMHADAYTRLLPLSDVATLGRGLSLAELSLLDAPIKKPQQWYQTHCWVRQEIKKEIRADMSNSDELRHTDNTTLIPPRLPDTLPHVYHRRRPTLGLLILPSVLPFPLTIRRTARMSVLPIKPNLAERARISTINLDDYQLDLVTPPPSPSSPFSMAAYQRMIA